MMTNRHSSQCRWSLRWSAPLTSIAVIIITLQLCLNVPVTCEHGKLSDQKESERSTTRSDNSQQVSANVPKIIQQSTSSDAFPFLSQGKEKSMPTLKGYNVQELHRMLHPTPPDSPKFRPDLEAEPSLSNGQANDWGQRGAGEAQEAILSSISYEIERLMKQKLTGPSSISASVRSEDSTASNQFPARTEPALPSWSSRSEDADADKGSSRIASVKSHNDLVADSANTSTHAKQTVNFLSNLGRLLQSHIRVKLEQPQHLLASAMHHRLSNAKEVHPDLANHVWLPLNNQTAQNDADNSRSTPKYTPSSTATTQYSLHTNAIPPTIDPPLPTIATSYRAPDSRPGKSRRKRQLYTRGFDGNILGTFASSFPVFSTNILADSLFSGGLSGLFDGGRYGSESKVHSVSSLSPGAFLASSNTAPHYDSMEQFPNPFPTVPMDSFDFEAFKSASEDDAVFGKTSYSATAFPPMNFNPQTGTFYEPVFGSHIPASLMGDFTPITSVPSNNRLRFPPKIGPIPKAVENSTFKTHVASPTGKAKLVAYEYMYKPLSMLRASSKRPPLRDRIPVSTTQISYEKVNLPPLRDTVEPTSKPTYKLDSPLKSGKAAPVTWYTNDPNEANSLSGGFTGMSAEHFIPKPVFTPDKNSDTGKSSFAASASSSSSSKQKQNFAHKPMYPSSSSSRTIPKPAVESREKYSQNQLTPHVVYATQPELPLKQYRDYHHHSFNHEPVLSYKPPVYPVKSPLLKHDKPADTNVHMGKHYSLPAPDTSNSVGDTDPWKYISSNPVGPDIPRPVFIPAVKTFTSPPFRKHRPLFPESVSHQTPDQTHSGLTKQSDRGQDHPKLPPDHGSEQQHYRPDTGVVDTTPGYGQKLNSKLTTSSQRNKITPPQVVKSATYHQTARPPYTRPYPISTTTSPPPASTSRVPIEPVIKYDFRIPDRQRFPAPASQSIPNARPEPEDDSQEYSIATPKLQSLQYMDFGSTTTTAASNENRDHRTMFETNIDYVDTDSKPDLDRNTESSKSSIRLQANVPRGSSDKGSESGGSGDDRPGEELDEEEEVEQTIQTPPQVTDKNVDEAKKTINLFKKRPDYTKLYSKYTKSTASPVYRSSTTTTASTTTTTTPSHTTTTTTVSPIYSPSLQYDSEEQDRDRQSPSSFGSRLSHGSRNPIVSVRTSTSTKTIKSYPYSPKPTASFRNKQSAEKSEASDADQRWTKHTMTSTTSAPPKSFPTLNRFRSRFSSTTTWRPTTSLTNSWTTTSTTATPAESSTPTLFVGKLGNLQDLGMFDVDDPEEEEAIDVPVFSKDTPEDASSTTSDPLSHFRKVYTSNSAGALNARLTGQRVTKTSGSNKASGYLNSFFGDPRVAQQPPSQETS